MRRLVFLLVRVILTVMLIGGLVACKQSSISTSDNASPGQLYKEDPEIDLFVYEKTAYVNAVTNDWVMELELEKGEVLGRIKRTNIKSRFKEFDATLLDPNTIIYTVPERNDILLVEINHMLVPYLAYREG